MNAIKKADHRADFSAFLVILEENVITVFVGLKFKSNLVPYLKPIQDNHRHAVHFFRRGKRCHRGLTSPNFATSINTFSFNLTFK